MQLRNLTQKIEFQINGVQYSVEPCIYDAEHDILGLQINFPEDTVQAPLYNFSDLSEVKAFVLLQLQLNIC